MLLVFGLVIFQNARFAEKDDESARLTSLIDGKYSIDGGEWKETDNKKPINEHFRKAVFKEDRRHNRRCICCTYDCRRGSSSYKHGRYGCDLGVYGLAACGCRSASDGAALH